MPRVPLLPLLVVLWAKCRRLDIDPPSHHPPCRERWTTVDSAQAGHPPQQLGPPSGAGGLRPVRAYTHAGIHAAGMHLGTRSAITPSTRRPAAQAPNRRRTCARRDHEARQLVARPKEWAKQRACLLHAHASHMERAHLKLEMPSCRPLAATQLELRTPVATTGGVNRGSIIGSRVCAICPPERAICGGELSMDTPGGKQQPEGSKRGRLRARRARIQVAHRKWVRTRRTRRNTGGVRCAQRAIYRPVCAHPAHERTQDELSWEGRTGSVGIQVAG